MPMDASIFEMSGRDVSEAMELSRGAGWNQTPEDWRALLELEPEGCLGLACDGRLAATTTLFCHDRRLAWIGMVLTRAEYQRRGYARRLMERALELAEARGIGTVKLDATDAGRHLYETLGFRAEQVIERWAGAGAPPEAGLGPGGPPRAFMEQLDQEAFGADRSRFLRLLAKRKAAMGAQDAFLMWRPGYRASYIGPCISRTP
jgi:GNAT superfamily N-acetyltransferase